MTLHRSIPPSLSAETVAAVDARLKAIRRDHGVHIPLAIESGSRAWGFPSPDSDYDCRFVFVRPVDQHLSLWPLRDVIETPIEGELDVNGWDFAKALKLLLKGNAVILEWLRSPIAYGVDVRFRDDFLTFAERFADRDRIRSHYLHLGVRQRSVHLDRDASVRLKKVFYALRPAAALRWLRLRPDQSVPPMHFQTLMDEGDWPSEVHAVVDDLLARKAVTREMGEGVVHPAIWALIDAELGAASDVDDLRFRRLAPEAAAEAERLYRATLHRLDGA